MLKRAGLQVARGFAMGTADIIPGVSGGTIALLLGIYERLVTNIATAARALGTGLRGDFRGAQRRLGQVEWGFLIPLLAGILAAVVALSSLLDRLLEDHPEAMAGLFFGLVAASVVVAWDMQRRHDGLALLVMLAVAVGLFLVLGYQTGPVADPSLLAFLGAGAIAICAMILPGISGAFLLLMIGMYASVLHAVNERELLDLAVFGVGVVVGISLFSSVLTWLLDRAHDIVLAGLIGLMLGSLRVLWPWPNGVGIISDEADEVVDGSGLDWPAADEILVPVLLGLAAFAVVIAVSRRVSRQPARVS